MTACRIRSSRASTPCTRPSCHALSLARWKTSPTASTWDKAKAALAESGHPNCGPIKISVREAQERLEISQSLQNTWGQLGCDIELIVGTGAQTLDRYRAREHDIYMGAWGPDYPDPNTNAATFAQNPDNAQEAGNTGYLAWPQRLEYSGDEPEDARCRG